MRLRLIGAALAYVFAVAAAPTAASAAAAGDAARGETLFKQRCGVCHSVVAGDATQKPGPNMAKLAGRKAGTVAGFRYSPALKAWGQAWTPHELDEFLTAPTKEVPGTFMVMTVPVEKDRADIVAYLGTLK